MYKAIRVYDLDGVLVDSSHRYRNKPDGTIDLQYWIENRTPEKIAKDKILPRARQYLADCLNPARYTVICTSRVYHSADIEFIVGRLGAPDKLFMRPEGNNDADGVLKRKQLAALFNLRQFNKLPRYLWEDNNHNIAALSHMFDRVFFIQSNQGA
ncbi:MAG: hypothetical protein OEQ39_27900 [Gammaproteobacteria bacterium]|nr:hypothetical protein [Gammaproteobacteria bacterium]